MQRRSIQTVILIFWLASMTWLVGTKIVPSLRRSNLPDQRDFRPERSPPLETVCWTIRWRAQSVGWARTIIRRQPLGHGRVASTVHFDNLPAGKILQDAIGTKGILAKLFPMRDTNLNVTLTANSTMEFDPFGSLERFDATIALADIGELVRLRGVVHDGELRLRALPGNGISVDPLEARQPVFEQTISLPSAALVTDSLAPQSRLANLSVGQTWQFRSYRAFPPNSPYRVVQATVEREEMVPWEDDVEPCYLVSFADVGGSGVTTAQAASSHLWVREDGTVVKQRMRFGTATVEFIRRPEGECQDE